MGGEEIWRQMFEHSDETAKWRDVNRVLVGWAKWAKPR